MPRSSTECFISDITSLMIFTYFEYVSRLLLNRNNKFFVLQLRKVTARSSTASRHKLAAVISWPPLI